MKVLDSTDSSPKSYSTNFFVLEIDKAQEMISFLENVPYKYSKPIIDVLLSLREFKREKSVSED